MALIFIGKSECPLCNQVFVTDDEIVSLPAISDQSHALYAFFDAGFHKACYDNWDKKDEAELIAAKEIEAFKKAN